MTGAAGRFACVSPSKRSSVGTIALADRLNRVRELVPLSERVIARATGTDETTARAWMDRRDAPAGTHANHLIELLAASRR